MEEYLWYYPWTRQDHNGPRQLRSRNTRRLQVDEHCRNGEQCTAGKWGRAVCLDEELAAPSARIEELDCIDAAVVGPNVPNDEQNVNLIDLYSVGHVSVLEQRKAGGDEVPFKQMLQLKGPQGETVHISALFDGGAMVGAMCSSVFQKVKHRLSRRRL
jgi:hypothetical protein